MGIPCTSCSDLLERGCKVSKSGRLSFCLVIDLLIRGRSSAEGPSLPGPVCANYSVAGPEEWMHVQKRGSRRRAVTCIAAESGRCRGEGLERGLPAAPVGARRGCRLHRWPGQLVCCDAPHPHLQPPALIPILLNFCASKCVSAPASWCAAEY